MHEKYNTLISDVNIELSGIKSWINKHSMDSNVRYLVSYAVIKTSGTIEVIFKNIIYDCLSIGTNINASEYLNNSIVESSCNPNTGNIENILQKINVDWKEEFSKLVKSSGKKSDLNSLVQLRNDFSHGNSINVSVETVTKYFDSGCFILEILNNVINPIEASTCVTARRWNNLSIGKVVKNYRWGHRVTEPST